MNSITDEPLDRPRAEESKPLREVTLNFTLQSKAGDRCLAKLQMPLPAGHLPELLKDTQDSFSQLYATLGFTLLDVTARCERSHRMTEALPRAPVLKLVQGGKSLLKTAAVLSIWIWIDLLDKAGAVASSLPLIGVP